ncbi:class I SAM-dependent methyltransferase [Nocardia miyunensis]|uniref:class I SAM-dependent methyltransferase n=1 Tax=Nocardia miyunensis TaxID=282684 RepID=UPI00082FCC0D|nr:class I SAM-dependent methyltransferase [Nocardia miyunensis]
MRTEGDSWDITTSVGSTALFVAAARALAGRDPSALAVDPFAEVFVRAAGPEWSEMLDGGAPAELLAESEFGRGFQEFQAARTRYFDDFVAAAIDAGIRQVVILAAGLDSRAYRLHWPEDTIVYELDRSRVLEFKRETLAANGDKPLVDRREVVADLREDWPRALREQGFDRARPTAWLVEGLLIYLPADAQEQLFDTIDALSVAGSRVAVEQMDPLPEDAAAAIGEMPDESETGSSGQWTALIYNEPRSEVTARLTTHDWRAERTDVPDYLRAHGRPVPNRDPREGLVPALVSLVTGIRS